VSVAVPRGVRDTEAALHYARTRLPPGMPQLLPFGEFGRFVQLVSIAVDLVLRSELSVQLEDFDGVHADFCGEVFQRGAGEIGSLLIARRSPRALRSGIDGDRSPDLTDIRNVGVDVGLTGRVYVLEAAGSPGERVESGDRAVLFACYFDLGECRGTIARDHLFRR